MTMTSRYKMTFFVTVSIVMIAISAICYRNEILYWGSPWYHLNSKLLFSQEASRDILEKLYGNRTSTAPAVTLTAAEVEKLFPEQANIISDFSPAQELLVFFEREIDKKREDEAWTYRYYSHRLADSSTFTIPSKKGMLYIYAFNDRAILVDFP